MNANRLKTRWGSYEPIDSFQMPDPRRTARLAIEEVLAEAARGAKPARTRLELPATVPNPQSNRAPRARVRRRWRRRRRRGVVGFTLALATCIGLVFGSGLFNAQDRATADLVAAQQGSLEVYTLPEVHGHPGAQPAPQRSTSIREFLGMASAF